MLFFNSYGIPSEPSANI